MKDICFSIIRWEAWAPAMASRADWQEWSAGNKAIAADFTNAPQVDSIPAMQRRKLSNLSRMSLQVALECARDTENISAVFASRYGEWTQTLKLLRSIYEQEDLSPAGFSLSVHNTAAGLYSIFAGNTAPYTALAGQDATFSMALLEALGRLQAQKNILLVVAEEAIPQMYDHIFPEPITPHAVALLLGKGDAKTSLGRFNLRSSANAARPVEALDFLKWFLKNDQAPIKMPLFEICHA